MPAFRPIRNPVEPSQVPPSVNSGTVEAAIAAHNSDPSAHPSLAGSGGAVIPVYTGDSPPVLVYDIDGSPVYVEL